MSIPTITNALLHLVGSVPILITGLSFSRSTATGVRSDIGSSSVRLHRQRTNANSTGFHRSDGLYDREFESPTAPSRVLVATSPLDQLRTAVNSPASMQDNYEAMTPTPNNTHQSMATTAQFNGTVSLLISFSTLLDHL